MSSFQSLLIVCYFITDEFPAKMSLSSGKKGFCTNPVYSHSNNISQNLYTLAMLLRSLVFLFSLKATLDQADFY